LQGGFIKNFMETVVPLIRDKSLLISSEGVMAMTQHMCEKGNGSAAVTWLLTCRGAGSTVDHRLVLLTRGRFSRAKSNHSLRSGFTRGAGGWQGRLWPVLLRVPKSSLVPLTWYGLVVAA
jgi:hypothetical protein